MAALLGVATLIGCGTGRTASGNKTIVAENRTSDKEASTPSADTCLNTKLRLRYFYEEAAKQQALGNYDDAYMLLLHCKRIDPNAAEVHYTLSNYDESLNSKEMAIADIKRAAELNPDNNTYLERLAMTYISTKDYDNAIKSYEKLYAANPDRTEVLEILLKRQRCIIHCLTTTNR